MEVEEEEGVFVLVEVDEDVASMVVEEKKLALRCPSGSERGRRR